MPASTSWLQGGLDEVDGSGRGWVSNKASSPSASVSCCFCSNRVLLCRVPVGCGARALVLLSCLLCAHLSACWAEEPGHWELEDAFGVRRRGNCFTVNGEHQKRL